MNVKDYVTSLPGYFTTKETAEALGYASPDSIKLMCAQGQIACYKVGKTWLIPAEQVQALADRDTGNRGGRGLARK